MALSSRKCPGGRHSFPDRSGVLEQSGRALRVKTASSLSCRCLRTLGFGTKPCPESLPSDPGQSLAHDMERHAIRPVKFNNGPRIMCVSIKPSYIGLSRLCLLTPKVILPSIRCSMRTNQHGRYVLGYPTVNVMVMFLAVETQPSTGRSVLRDIFRSRTSI